MSEPAKMTVTRLQRKKRSGEKITLLTAYDFPMASFIDQAGMDIVLVSDAVGTVGNGRTEAVSVTVDEMIYHTRAVRNGIKHSLVVTTLPFGTYCCPDDARHNALRLMKEGGADAVHVEGTSADGDIVRAIISAGVPVMGHIGVTKQKIARAGRIQLFNYPHRTPARRARQLRTRWRWRTAEFSRWCSNAFPSASPKR